MQVSEIFLSIQGEGIRAGLVAAFVRLAGCDLRCLWCDTPYALQGDQGQAMTVDHISRQILDLPAREVVVTGGEPLVQAETPELIERLTTAGKRVTLETNATQYRPVNCTLVSLSVKLASSVPHTGPWAAWAQTHDRTRVNVPAIRSFLENHPCQLKFVVADEADLAEIDAILAAVGPVDPELVLLMPQARNRDEYHHRSEWVAQQCIARGYRFGPRLHLEIWGGKRGK